MEDGGKDHCTELRAWVCLEPSLNPQIPTLREGNAHHKQYYWVAAKIRDNACVMSSSVNDY